MDLDFISKLVKHADTKIIMLVMDGIGGLPRVTDNKTELETAYKPNLDNLANNGICGLHLPVGPGITPGSGPGHLGIFGFNAEKYQIGRGVLEALGIDFDLKPGDIAARGNFCTIDKNGNITDRRAGRISTEKNQEICKFLSERINIPRLKVFVETVKEHRFLVVLRGEGLKGNLIDTDPQEIGAKPLEPKGGPGSENTVEIVKKFLNQTRDILSDNHPANMVLLRGFSEKPTWPSFPKVFGLRSAAIACYPMYRGLARLIGMDLLETGQTIEDEFKTLEENWDKYDFFFLHIKKTDSYGEDGDFDSKVKVIEQVDKLIPRLMNLNPDVVIVTGDHSTPSILKSHSWHPVPLLIWSKYCRPDNVKIFGERACVSGGLGPMLPAVEILPIAMANALRLEKFGA
ncbi:MAG: 2,3-bisphosphoglycerate-independent phosphoglycerate mutase [Candidatus Thermoplasmatota archaeon]|nr:2,3-bisphosphoglycerate-independent phosphoglycerate mutase [Candidatus Thermoplasmatota archaeon]